MKFSNTGLVIIIACMIFSKFTKHRSFAHSILGIVLFIIGFKLLLGNMSLYFAIGSISHMIADTLTNSGIEVLYPIRKKAALKLIHTVSILDNALGVLAFVYFIFTMSKIF
ncbi:metal-dependent hydrolase [Clostridium felsineum]|uniref:metal-dependent hydrolase n=1 Tax=Clostridium felsineum TaxID=36839 RepID=UPI0020333CD0|nr:metal-dependent hydrolase [Clostridium felsineum]